MARNASGLAPPSFVSTFPVSCWLPWSPVLCLPSSNVSPSDHQRSPLFNGASQLWTDLIVLSFWTICSICSLSAGVSGVKVMQPISWPVCRDREKRLVAPGDLCHHVAVFCMEMLPSLWGTVTSWDTVPPCSPCPSFHRSQVPQILGGSHRKCVPKILYSLYSKRLCKVVATIHILVWIMKYK